MSRSPESCVLEGPVVAFRGVADDERDRDGCVHVAQHPVHDGGKLVACHAVNRVGVPCLHELAELALPARERLPAGGLRGAELRELVEGALGVDGVAAEEGDVDRGRTGEDERAHRGGMELQVDLRRRCPVGPAVYVELPVAERRPHRIQVVHRHPRPVLGHVAAVRLRSARAALVDEQEVAERPQLTRLPAPGERLLGGGVSPARPRDTRPRPFGPPSRAQAGRRRGARSCARSAPRGSPGRRRCRSGRRSPAPRTAPAATNTAPRPKRTLGRRRRRHQHRCRRRPPGRPESQTTHRRRR